MTVVEATASTQPSEPPGRGKVLLLAVFGVLVVSALVVLAWTWRHPTAFADTDDWTVGHRAWPVGQAAYVGMTSPGDRSTASVQLQDAAPHGLVDSTGATFAYFLCTPGSGPAGSAIGIGSEADVRESCDSLVPAIGASFSLADQQLVVAITPSRDGVVTLHGLDVTYADGWQTGTQVVGGDVRIRVHGSR